MAWERPGAIVQFLGLDDDVLAFGYLEALDDVLGRYFPPGHVR
jgi:hypothetical protein|nr:hypothetical protein [Streptomyces graminofaciens]